MRVGSKLMIERVCVACGKARLVSYYRQTELCGECVPKKGRKGRKHGLSKTPLYKAWEGMMMRCGHLAGGDETDLKRYRERGITVCEEWQKDRAAFFNWALVNGYERGLQIDRRENDEGYSPGNCRWVTCAVNNQNRRSTKLSMKIAREIRARAAAGERQVSIVRSTGIGSSQVSMIVRQLIWKEEEKATKPNED